MTILPIKKVYCNKCKRLVRGQEQSAGGSTGIICPKCNQKLWVHENTRWRYAGKL